MKRLIWAMIITGAALAVPVTSFGQYLNQKLDYDTTSDFAGAMFLSPSGKAFLYGASYFPDSAAQKLSWVQLDASGNTVLDKNHRGAANVFYYGSPGGCFESTAGNYVFVYTKFDYNPIDYYTVSAGLLSVNQETIEPVFFKDYTDTSLWREGLYDCLPLSDKTILAVGYYGSSTPGSPLFGLINKVDSSGDLIWRKQLMSVSVNWSVDVVSPDIIAVGASKDDYNSNWLLWNYRPVFMLLDTAGNVLYQKSYPTGYNGGGYLQKDKAGGYFHWGRKDSLVFYSGGFSDYTDFTNFPGYIAHLDDSFNFTWTHVLFDTLQADYHIDVQNVKQLSDSNYLLMGSLQQINDIPSIEAYVAKISHTDGEILWQQKLHVDTGTFNCYLVDAVEKPDGSILLAGAARDVYAPEWRQQDFWLVGLDSDGCPYMGCGPTGIIPMAPKPAEVQAYPNPTTGEFSIHVPQAGEIILYNMQGQVVARYAIAEGENPLAMPPGIAPGLYAGRLRYATGGGAFVRIDYRP